jgi:hypothetical protein
MVILFRRENGIHDYNLVVRGEGGILDEEKGGAHQN